MPLKRRTFLQGTAAAVRIDVQKAMEVAKNIYDLPSNPFDTGLITAAQIEAAVSVPELDADTLSSFGSEVYNKLFQWTLSGNTPETDWGFAVTLPPLLKQMSVFRDLLQSPPIDKAALYKTEGEALLEAERKGWINTIEQVYQTCQSSKKFCEEYASQEAFINALYHHTYASYMGNKQLGKLVPNNISNDEAIVMGLTAIDIAKEYGHDLSHFSMFKASLIAKAIEREKQLGLPKKSLTTLLRFVDTFTTASMERTYLAKSQELQKPVSVMAFTNDSVFFSRLAKLVAASALQSIVPSEWVRKYCNNDKVKSHRKRIVNHINSGGMEINLQNAYLSAFSTAFPNIELTDDKLPHFDPKMVRKINRDYAEWLREVEKHPINEKAPSQVVENTSVPATAEQSATLPVGNVSVATQATSAIKRWVDTVKPAEPRTSETATEVGTTPATEPSPALPEPTEPTGFHITRVAEKVSAKTEQPFRGKA